MKSSGEIRVDYENAKRQADRLDALASDLERRVVNKLSSTGDNLNAAWKGQSASQYIRKTQDLRNQVRNTARELRNIASDIRRIARQVWEAEMRALEIAQRRKYGG